MTTERRIHTIDTKVQRMSTVEFPRTAGDVFGSFMMCIGLRGFWPLSSLDESWNVVDTSGQGRTLSINGSPTFSYINSIPYIVLNGSSQYLSRTDEAGLDITGALTLGAWMYCTTNGSTRMPIGKFGASGNYSYCIHRINTNYYRAIVSGDGTVQTVKDFGTVSPINTWEFVVGRYIPSTEVSIFVNAVKLSNTTSIPASIFSGNGNFAIGRWDGGPSQYFPGRIALPFLASASLDDLHIQRLFNITRPFFGV